MRTTNYKEWKRDFSKLINSRNPGYGHVIIIKKEDDPELGFKCRRFLGSKGLYVWLGVSSTPNRLAFSILHGLSDDRIKTNSFFAVRKSIALKLINKKKFKIIIDNCQFIKANQIAKLVVLINLLRQVQFVFIYSTLSPSLRAIMRDRRYRIFLKSVSSVKYLFKNNAVDTYDILNFKKAAVRGWWSRRSKVRVSRKKSIISKEIKRHGLDEAISMRIGGGFRPSFSQEVLISRFRSILYYPRLIKSDDYYIHIAHVVREIGGTVKVEPSYIFNLIILTRLRKLLDGEKARTQERKIVDVAYSHFSLGKKHHVKDGKYETPTRFIRKVVSAKFGRISAGELAILFEDSALRGIWDDGWKVTWTYEIMLDLHRYADIDLRYLVSFTSSYFLRQSLRVVLPNLTRLF